MIPKDKLWGFCNHVDSYTNIKSEPPHISQNTKPRLPRVFLCSYMANQFPEKRAHFRVVFGNKNKLRFTSNTQSHFQDSTSVRFFLLFRLYIRISIGHFSLFRSKRRRTLCLCSKVMSIIIWVSSSFSFKIAKNFHPSVVLI